jgi:hypothetical protein
MLISVQRRNLANQPRHRAIPYMVLGVFPKSVMLLNTWRLAAHLSSQRVGAIDLCGMERS